MKAEITVYHSKEQAWLVPLLAKKFDELVEEVEKEVKEKRIGMPWEKEERDDLPEGFSWELSQGFEVSFSEHDDEGSIKGSSWMLRDFWAGEEPPPDEREEG